MKSTETSPSSPMISRSRGRKNLTSLSSAAARERHLRRGPSPVLTAVNWTTIGRDARAHPGDWVELLIACVLMQPVIWYRAALLRGN
jgi:hypothetical protein